MYGGLDDADIEDMWPSLVENKDDFKDDTDVDDNEGNYSGVDEKVKPVQGNRDEYWRRVDTVNKKFDLKPMGKRSLSDLNPRELKKYFAARDKALGHDESVNEDAPPGMEDVVKKLKADGNSDEEAFAIAWSAYNSKKRRERDYYDEASKIPTKLYNQVLRIAMHNSGDMEKAIKQIERLKKGLSDNKDVMNILKIANESVSINESDIHLPSGKIKLIPKSKWSAIKKKYNVTVDPKDPEWVAGHPNDLYKWATAKDGLGMSKGDVKKKYNHITPEYKGASLIKNKQREDANEGRNFVAVHVKYGKTNIKNASSSLDAAKKAAKIWKIKGEKTSGIDVHLAEGVAVDRRTIGFKAAMIRNEKAKKVREKAKLKKEKKKEQEVLDARYEYDGEVDVVLAAANKSIFGETAANAAGAGSGVDMAPNARNKKKDKFKVVKRANY